MANIRIIETDTISIKNLSLPNSILAPDVWGKSKEQPALLSISLALREIGFSTAASKDELDNSTVHYGELAKGIRKACSEGGQSVSSILEQAENIAVEMATKGAHFILACSTFELCLPKASMYGDGATVTLITEYQENGGWTNVRGSFAVESMKVMTLVGVNGYERKARQPLVASVWVYYDCDEGELMHAGLFGLEGLLVEVIHDTAFETLESLADFTVKQLQERMLNEILPRCQVRLRLEKPRAIAFADAPAVEVIRVTAGDKQTLRSGHPLPITVSTKGSDEVGSLPGLHVIKPYV